MEPEQKWAINSSVRVTTAGSISTKCDGSDVSWQNSEPSIAISVSAILSRSYFQGQTVVGTCTI